MAEMLPYFEPDEKLTQWAAVRAAVAGRTGWRIDQPDTSALSPHADFVFREHGHCWYGHVVGLRNGWHWSVWCDGNPRRSTELPPAATLDEALHAVEAFVDEAIAERAAASWPAFPLLTTRM